MLVKLIKTFILMSAISIGMMVMLLIIYVLLKRLFGIPDESSEDLPYGIEQACERLFEILLVAIVIFGSITISLSITWIIQDALCSIWSS